MTVPTVQVQVAVRIKGTREVKRAAPRPAQGTLGKCELPLSYSEKQGERVLLQPKPAQAPSSVLSTETPEGAGAPEKRQS